MRSFLRSNNVWRLVGLLTALLGLFATNGSEAFHYEGVAVSVKGLVVGIGLATFAAPLLREAWKSWRGK